MAGFDMYFAVGGGRRVGSCSEVPFYCGSIVPTIVESLDVFDHIFVTCLGRRYYW